MPNCHLSIHKLYVCIKRNAFYNFQIDESFMGRYNEKRDVFHEERMLSGTKNQESGIELVTSQSMPSGIDTPGKVNRASTEHRYSLVPLKP